MEAWRRVWTNVRIILPRQRSNRDAAGPPDGAAAGRAAQELRLTGTKEGCGEGECGACAVIDGELVNSCLVPLLQAEGRNDHDDRRRREPAIAARRAGGVHRARRRAVRHLHAGMVLAAVTLLERNPPSDRTTRSAPALAGNLCRCTGLHADLRSRRRPPIGGARAVAPELHEPGTLCRTRSTRRSRSPTSGGRSPAAPISWCCSARQALRTATSASGASARAARYRVGTPRSCSAR